VKATAAVKDGVFDEAGHITHYSKVTPVPPGAGETWEQDSYLDTLSHIANRENTAVEINGQGLGRGVSLTFAYSSAFMDLANKTGGTDSWGGYGTMAAATNNSKTKVKAEIPTVFLDTLGGTLNTPGNDDRYTEGLYIGGNSLAYLESKPPKNAVGTNYWDILHFEWQPDEPGDAIYRALERDDTTSDMNYQVIWVSGHTMSHEHGEEYNYFVPEYYLGIPLPPIPPPD